MASLDGYPNLTDPACPWGALREVTGLPNVKWCEQTLCAWVAEPANTWSNLAFIVGAGVLWWVTRKDAERALRFWATASFWVGVSSFVYHASITFLTQVFDFFGMYIFFVLVLLLNLVRLGRVPAASLFRVLWPTIAGLTALTVVVAKVGLPVQGLIGVLLVLVLVTEVLASRRATVAVGHRYLVLSLVTIAVAAAFSGADASRLWCVPQHHVLQGHAIWHVLDGVGLVLAHFHYRPLRVSFA